jgi:hypothetical protein
MVPNSHPLKYSSRRCWGLSFWSNTQQVRTYDQPECWRTPIVFDFEVDVVFRSRFVGCNVYPVTGWAVDFKAAINRANIRSQLSTLLISDHRQLPCLDYSIDDNEENGQNFENLSFLFPAAICLAAGAAIVAYVLFCCPIPSGVIIKVSASMSIYTCVQLFVSRVLGLDF